MHIFSRILKDELICALGCTEPIAVALAAARAKQILGSNPVKIDAYCSGNIVKNVMGVQVPNSGGMKGIESAVALGISGGVPEKGLEVLSDLTARDIEMAKGMIADKVIEVHLKEGVPSLDVEIHLEDAEGNHVIVQILNKHNNIVRITRNGEEFLEAQVMGKESDRELYGHLNMTAILDYADAVDLDEIRVELENQITLNRAISAAGLDEDYGSSIGKILLMSNDDIRTRARAKAAAGSDARMSGCALPVVINAGSGNQGITCSIPVLEYAEEMGADREKTMRALIVSNLIALHIKQYIGRLSAYCGVTSAGAAAGAGISYLHDPENREMLYETVGNALMIDSGMVCDGAKPSCAAKIASAVDAGITGFEMALNGRSFQAGDGLMKGDIEETIQSIGRLGAQGMKATDTEVLNIMLNKD